MEHGDKILGRDSYSLKTDRTQSLLKEMLLFQPVLSMLNSQGKVNASRLSLRGTFTNF